MFRGLAIPLEEMGNPRDNSIRNCHGSDRDSGGVFEGRDEGEGCEEVPSEPGHLPTCRLGLLSRLVSAQASSSALPEARGLLSPKNPGRDKN